MKPWMDEKDIREIENILLNKKSKKLDILEWGSGGSTEYFTNFLIKSNIQFSWTSLEYNKSWYEKVLKLNLKNVILILFDVGNNKLKQRYTNMDDYVNYPISLNKKFDIILVDGRKRRRCMIIASKILKDNGTVLLHDAQRKYYSCSLKYFKWGKFLSKNLWSGNV